MTDDEITAAFRSAFAQETGDPEYGTVKVMTRYERMAIEPMAFNWFSEHGAGSLLGIVRRGGCAQLEDLTNADASTIGAAVRRFCDWIMSLKPKAL